MPPGTRSPGTIPTPVRDPVAIYNQATNNGLNTVPFGSENSQINEWAFGPSTLPGFQSTGLAVGLTPEQRDMIAGLEANNAGLDLARVQAMQRMGLLGKMPTGGGGGGAAAAAANRQADIDIAAARRQLGLIAPTYADLARQYEGNQRYLAQQFASSRQGLGQALAQLAIQARAARVANRADTRAYRSDVVTRGAAASAGAQAGYRDLADQLAAQLGTVRQERKGARRSFADARQRISNQMRNARFELRGAVRDLMETNASLADRIAKLELQKQVNSAGAGGGGQLAWSKAWQMLGAQQEIDSINQKILENQAQIDGLNSIPGLTQPTPGTGGHVPPGGYRRPDGR
jgi:hypothetical protein